jgi:transposase
VGPLPIVNRFIERLGLMRCLEEAVPTDDRRCAVSHAEVLGTLIRTIMVEREPIYRQAEMVRDFDPAAFGVAAEQLARIDDDRMGRALDALFDADRTALGTTVVLAAHMRFGVKLDEQHNDSTSISFSGQYRSATGREIRGKRARWISYGHSKDHRPDLKQLLWIMTTSRDGSVPTQFRSSDGRTNDSTTHIETWDQLCKLKGGPDFLYVADSKLCTREAMDHIHYRSGRFVTVLPRSRIEDKEFRKWVQTREPAWEKVWDRPNPTKKNGPRDRWFVFKAELPSRESWPVVWVYSTLLSLRQEQSRRERLACAMEDLQRLKAGLAGRRSRVRTKAELGARIDKILRQWKVTGYLRVERHLKQEHRFTQLQRGRPGPKTAYRRKTRRRFDITWATDEVRIAYDRKSDGMYPLLTNDRTLSPRQVLEAHKGQPALEKRFSNLKSVHELAPVFLKNEARIEAFFFVYFLVLMLHALIERELRLAMEREKIDQLPLYPEGRACRRPTTEHILRLFALTQRHRLMHRGREHQTFRPELTSIQRKTLRLLGVPERRFH